MSERRYNRVVVKLSGRAFAGDDPIGIDSDALAHVAGEILSLQQLGVEIAAVVGGGNIFRGNVADDWNIERAEADNIGMLGTVINGLLLRGVLHAHGLEDVRVLTAVPITSMAEPYIRLRALGHLERKKIVILACGIGQPYVTTDYPAVQRAVELRADAVLVAKDGVDGVYDADPRTDPDASRYTSVDYNGVLERGLKVMDQGAIILARDHGMPLHVFDFKRTGAMTALCRGENIGTEVAAGVATATA